MLPQIGAAWQRFVKRPRDPGYPDSGSWKSGRAGYSAGMIISADPDGFQPETFRQGENAIHTDIAYFYRIIVEPGKPWEIEVYDKMEHSIHGIVIQKPLMKGSVEKLTAPYMKAHPGWIDPVRAYRLTPEEVKGLCSTCAAKAIAPLKCMQCEAGELNEAGKCNSCHKETKL